ncbi:MAG: lysine--tRNA ligase [Candidatus Bipolaricaulota bacterium]|nr:lysine--tRNA ligase [Candidatus Bipolaricaulota bacterium]MCS7275168.1 lysine--tRNA ligase [Candidatus Bipolaricaulota bacterium]MDW8110463.1 lysine--tRNA ligase [Candidatus Bipolaricaulota bacterium]MDW8329144.1 lysine--tRNA ligase [Candidatus Bipolaricaulota bacterium]
MDESNPLRAERLRKLEAWRQRGIDPYPTRFARTHLAQQLHELFRDLPAGADSQTRAALAGRITARRLMGGATFLDLRDGSGRIQLYATADLLKPEEYELFTQVDIGDFLGVEGLVFRTRRGELSIKTEKFTILAKALRPLPEKWHGLQDVEIRYRQRYLDLIANESARRIAVMRSRIVSAMRRFLDSEGFLEVETPILQPLYGGAAAKPFTTYHNALEMTLYLRISDELYLKRLIVGGLEKVYEIGKDFRNEGISTKHNPEFTQMECYWAYADYNDMMALTERMIAQIAREVLGSTRILYQGHEIDLSPPWRRLTLREAILAESGLDIEKHSTLEELRAEILRRKLQIDLQPTWGKQVDELLKVFVEPKLIQPTFILDYPVELSPLAKKKPGNPKVVERFEPFIGGMEFGNAFSELNDPIDQRERFLAQEALRRAGDEEAQVLDEDFLIALEYGMPPTGGLGIGIDRLTMILTDAPSIREVILFPTLRPRGETL